MKCIGAAMSGSNTLHIIQPLIGQHVALCVSQCILIHFLVISSVKVGVGLFIAIHMGQNLDPWNQLQKIFNCTHVQKLSNKGLSGKFVN